MTTTNNIVGICWLLLCIFWAVQWKWSKKTAKRAPSNNRFWYVASLVIGFLLLWNSGPTTHTFPLNFSLFSPTILSLNILAAILAILGVALAIWARIALGSNWSGSVQIKEHHELIVSGPYAFVRHPIYTAIFMLVTADVLITGTLGSIIALVIIFISFWIKLRQEEKFMLQQFPDQYPAYMHRVKRLVPLLF